MRKPSLAVIFFTVFIDLIGFGIVLPLLPIYSQRFGAPGWEIGLIMAAFSAMQFFFGPLWGRLSDRIGRRPVLLASTAGAVLSYAVFAIGSGLQDHRTALFVLLGSRALAGLCGANITAAQAYIADITPPEQRSRRMGLIGMAFGLGFTLGPFIGAKALKWFGHSGPGWVAAGLCAINFLMALFILVESRQPNSAPATPRPRLEQWTHTLRRPGVGLLVLIFALATFCFTCFETTLGLVISRNFSLDPDKPADGATVAYLFVFCGIVGAFVQGGPIGKLLRVLGESRLIGLSLILTAIGLAPMPFILGQADLSWGVLFQGAGMPWLMVFGALTALSVGSGLTRPPIFGLISNLTSADEQGEALGVAQSMGSLARILGPIFAASTLDLTRHIPALPYGLPYLVCAGLCLVIGLVAWIRLPAVVNKAKSAS